MFVVVQIKNMGDFEERILGEGLDTEAKTTSGVSGAFVIQLQGKLLDSTAHRIQRVVKKYLPKVDTEETTPIYLSLGDNSGSVHIGDVKLSMAFYKEFNSLVTPYKPEYFIYSPEGMIPFDKNNLTSTITVNRTYESEKFV